MSSPTVQAGAVVLAGGRSRRMGQDKAVLDFCGTRMIDRVVSCLSEVAEPIVVMTRSGSDVGDAAAVIVHDERPYAGPLPALVAGLRTTAKERNVVVACDMPFLNGPFLEHLCSLLDQSLDAVVPVTHDGAQPLHGAYGDCAIEPLLAAIASGERSLKGALERLHVRWVPEMEWKEFDPAGRSFLNVNTPGELERAVAMQAAG